MSVLASLVVKLVADTGDYVEQMGGAAERTGSILGTLGKVGLAVGAGIVGVGAGAAVMFGKMAADAAPLEGIQNAFQGVAGDADAMLAALRSGSAGMVADANLMRTYNEAAQLVGTTFANQLPDAMGYLGKVSAATGADMGFLLDSLTKGVGRLSPMILDNLGIQVSLAEATEQAASMYGVEADALTKAQQQAGMMQVTLAKLAQNTASMPDISENASTQMAQFGVQMQNLQAQVGMAFLPILKEVMGVFGELATTYGPMVADVVGRLAQMLGPLLGSALEALVPAVMSLLDALIPLVETIIGQVMPAFSAILEAVVGVAAALIGALAPVLGAVLEAILPVIVALVDMLAPILTEIISRILPILVPLLTGVAQQFGRLLMAIMPLVGTLLQQLVPVLLTILEALLPPLIDVFLALLDVFLMYVEATLPNLIAILEILLPILGGIAVIVAEVLGVAFEVLAGIITNVVNPALQWTIDHIFHPITELLEKIAAGLKNVAEWFGNLAKKVRELDLPPWMTPGSPTPLELGLRGIAKELQIVDRLMGGLDSRLAMQAVTAPAGDGGRLGNLTIHLYGSGDPEEASRLVVQKLQDRGLLSGTLLR